MPAITLYFKVHIPCRIKSFAGNNVGGVADCFDPDADKLLVGKLADECYLPANSIMLSLIRKHGGRFKISYSISGTALELLRIHRPDVIESFTELVGTGCVELLAETYYNSLSWLYSKKEFRRQVEQHHRLVKELFGVSPAVFRNTELIYNNELAAFVADMGYQGILCEGLDKILQGRTPNQIYYAPGSTGLRLLLRNVNLSDDIAFRFDETRWNEHPLTADKFASWLHAHSSDTCNINLFMDYETFGVHKPAATGIFEFLENLPAAVLADHTWRFNTASEALNGCTPAGVYDVPQFISWADKTRECCVWCENMMQNNMLKKIYSMENIVLTGSCESARHKWGKLQSADHFYNMSDTGRAANDAYQYLNPFVSAKAAYKNYLNVVTDFEIRLIQQGLANYKSKKTLAADAVL